MTASPTPSPANCKARLPAHASQNPAFRPGSPESEAILALRESCYGAGHTSAEIGEMLVEQGLFRSKRGAADAHVRACLNAGKSEFFSPSEILAIQSFTGVYAWLEFECRALGRQVPDPESPDDELRVAREEQARHEALARSAEERIRSLETRTNGSPRRSWIPNPGAKFSIDSLGQPIACSAGRSH